MLNAAVRSISTLPRHRTNNNNNSLVDVFDHLLDRFASTIHLCKQIHAHIIASGHRLTAFLAARLIASYARSGHLFDSQKLFHAYPFENSSNLLLWNSILRANVSHENYEGVLKLFVKMRRRGVLGDSFTLPLVIRACARMGFSRTCEIVHGLALEMGLGKHLHVANELVGMYAKLGRMRGARNVFEKMGVRSCVSWNMMVSGYAFNYDCDGVLEMFRRMELEGLEPNLVTWTSLISSHARCGRCKESLELFGSLRMTGIGVSAEVVAVVLSVCADLGAFVEGKVIHGCVIKGGFEDYVFVKNALICAYGKGGDVHAVRNLFLEMGQKNIVSWNALITSYADAGLCDEAFEIFSWLQSSGDCPVLRPNLISWSAVIGGFASQGQGEKSLELFRQMQLAKVMANAVTISTVLSVCAELAALNLGREIHGHVIRAAMDKSILVENGLVNMYTKCGCLREGFSVFEKIEEKDLISWNTMITGYGMHGLGANAVETFDQLVKYGPKPDGVTFISVLSACSHAGLVAMGRRLFNQMQEEFNIEPQMEHYACMVDLLSRAGLLQEASEIIKNMPMEPNAYVLSALLNSCRMHKNTEVAEQTASHIFGLEQGSTGSYMLLSNLYAASGRWEDSARVRASARTKGLKKNPGQSWIEVRNNVCVFSAGSNVPKGLEQVYEVLEELTLQTESEGYIPENSIILQSLDQK